MRSTLTQAEASFIRWERVARFASVGEDGMPHVVPVCPVLDGDAIVIASEDNAKIRNLRADPRCAIVFDSYVEDWDHNRQVQIRGTVTILSGGPEWDRAKALLDEKFRQYGPLYPITPGETLILRVAIERVSSEGL